MKPKQPTLREKVKVYEDLLHRIQLNREVTMDGEKVAMLLDRIGNWSYAHRQGNGEFSEREQRRLIDAAFWKLNE